MLAALVIVTAAVIAASCVVCWAAAAVSGGSPVRRRDLDRRRDHLRVHPDQVGSLDVELRLAESLPGNRAADVCRAARERRVPALVLWTWIELFDGELLALAVEAGLTSEELLHHVATGAAPDRRSLEIFAAFHGAVAS